MTQQAAGGQSPQAIFATDHRRNASRLWLELAAILFLAGALRLWRLGQNGYGLDYYAAGVRSMLASWHNFFYNAFDPAGFVSVDKPPVALWLQAASAKLFGFHGFSVLLPQVLEGVAAVAVVGYLVQRRFGAAAGRFAALVLALTPVSVAVDRSNNTDSCLVLVLLGAAWALTRAMEDGSRRWLFLAMALVGIGFNVKMLAAFVVLPPFVVVYLLGAPVAWRRRLSDLLVSGLVLLLVSLAWVFAYDLTPPARRPFAGSSRTNSMLELAVNHNGLQRFIPRGPIPPGAPAGIGPGGFGPGGWDRVPVGPLRLADRHLAGQVAWLFPLTVLGLWVAGRQARWRLPLGPAQGALLLWVGWALAYGIVYSAAGGIFRAYYLATLAPPLAALAGIGVVHLWGAYLGRGRPALLLPGALLLTTAWEAYIQSSVLGWTLDPTRGRLLAIGAAAVAQAGDWRTWLLLALVGGTLASAAGLLIRPLARPLSEPARRWAAGALGIGLAALLVTPAGWALSSVLAGTRGMMVSADLSRLVPGTDPGGLRRRDRLGGAGLTTPLIRFLTANRQGERYLLATGTAVLAAPIIVQTGEAVMAMGGFMGADPILSPEQLARLVGNQEVRFVLVGDLPRWGGPGGEIPGSQLAVWVRAHGVLVDPTLWRPPLPPEASPPMPVAPAPPRRGGRGFGFRAANWELFDLRPEAGLVPATSG